MLYIRKEFADGSALGEPVRRWALSLPSGLRGHKAREVKCLFPREQVVHGPAQLVGEHGQRCGFAGFTFEFREVRFSRLALADEEDRRFGKRPA